MCQSNVIDNERFAKQTLTFFVWIIDGVKLQHLPNLTEKSDGG